MVACIIVFDIGFTYDRNLRTFCRPETLLRRPSRQKGLQPPCRVLCVLEHSVYVELLFYLQQLHCFGSCIGFSRASPFFDTVVDLCVRAAMRFQDDEIV